MIRATHPAAGSQMRVISGYWKKIYACQIDGFVNVLREDQWTFTDSIRYSKPGCETIGGTSGSPIVDPTSREVIGINNTGNENGEECTMNNPCEVDTDGTITADEGTSYGQQMYTIYGCINAQSQFDLTVATCKLPGGRRPLAAFWVDSLLLLVPR